MTGKKSLSQEKKSWSREILIHEEKKHVAGRKLLRKGKIIPFTENFIHKHSCWVKNSCWKKKHKHYVVQNISVKGNIIISCPRKKILLTIEIFLLQKKILFGEENSCFRENFLLQWKNLCRRKRTFVEGK